ncbi:MAG TPA: hypothetical protein VJZ26_10295 [Blastocatellia bacterium]|nr:hypothetical protein [Blastocatellia bacterium]
MRIFSVLLSFSLALSLSPSLASGRASVRQGPGSARQLAAVRGEVIRLKPSGKGLLLITVRPAKDFAEVTVLARENDLVGSAIGRAGDSDLLGLLTDEARDEETITAAELNEGDVVSVIYDPQSQNRVLEIYVH